MTSTKVSSHLAWTLRNEMRFIDGLGGWKTCGKLNNWSYPRWLRQYIKVNGERNERWAVKAVEYAKQQLVEIGKSHG